MDPLTRSLSTQESKVVLALSERGRREATRAEIVDLLGGSAKAADHVIESLRRIVPDHRDPKGMGGARRDDHPDNIQATHWWCNEGKGSTRKD